MRKITTAGVESSPVQTPLWETLETYARGEIQQFVQRMLEEEVDDLLGRKKSEQPLLKWCVQGSNAQSGDTRFEDGICLVIQDQSEKCLGSSDAGIYKGLNCAGWCCLLWSSAAFMHIRSVTNKSVDSNGFAGRQLFDHGSSCVACRQASVYIT